MYCSIADVKVLFYFKKANLSIIESNIINKNGNKMIKLKLKIKLNLKTYLENKINIKNGIYIIEYIEWI